MRVLYAVRPFNINLTRMGTCFITACLLSTIQGEAGGEKKYGMGLSGHDWAHMLAKRARWGSSRRGMVATLGKNIIAVIADEEAT